MNIMKMMSLLGDPKKLEADMRETSMHLDTVEFEGKTDDGLVTVMVNGNLRLTATRFDQDRLANTDAAQVGVAVVEAVNTAMQQAQRYQAETMQRKMMETLGTGGAGGLLGGLLGGRK